ncbi:MAG: hypothetical protein J6W24_09135 [Prevotella sp.]|nr:hypothetical protein [Prevotella sp.]
MKKVFFLAVTTATVMLAACGGKVSPVSGDSDSIASDTVVEEAVVDPAAIKDSIRHTVGYIKQRIDSLYKHRSDRYGCSAEYNRLNDIADSVCEAQGGVWVDGDHWINGQDKDENWWYKVKKVTVGKDGATAIAEVLVHNFENNTIYLHLVYERGDWYVDDFRFRWNGNKAMEELSEKKRTREYLQEQNVKY